MSGEKAKLLFETHPFCRVQDRFGRGPFKPGMPDRWRDQDGLDFPAIQDEFGLSWLEEIPAGWHAGCAFRYITQAARWFSAAECARMAQLGYRMVTLVGCRVLRESAHQAIIVRPSPLRLAVARPWPHLTTAALDPWKNDAVMRATKDGTSDGE